MAEASPSAVVRVRRDDAVAIVEIDNPPINAGSTPVREGLLAAFRALANDETVAGIILIGAGSMFMAGSDMREMGVPVVDPSLPDVIDLIEACPVPVVAAIAGAALGGGYELALGCDARVAKPDAMVGLPECLLGMIPGAGGTQKLPRLAGLAKAIELICSGARLRADRAIAFGMVDEIVEGDLLAGAIRHLQGMGGKKRRAIELPVPPVDEAELEHVRAAALAAGGGRPHIALAMDTAATVLTLPAQEALAAEREIFLRLRAGRETAAMLHLFFAEREAAKLAEIESKGARSVKSVAVIGEGAQAIAIAVALLRAAETVTLVAGEDVGSPELDQTLDRALRQTRGGETARKRLRVVRSADALAGVDVIVEASGGASSSHGDLLMSLAGKFAPKGFLLTTMLDVDGTDVVPAIDTAVPILGLRLIGVPDRAKLVEIIGHSDTPPSAMATAASLARSARWLPIIARDGRGHIAERVWEAGCRQRDALVADGVPLADVVHALHRFGIAGDLAPGPVDGENPAASADVSSSDEGSTKLADQLLAAMADTAEALVEHGAVASPALIDLLLTTGQAFPRYRGGISFWAQERTGRLAPQPS